MKRILAILMFITSCGGARVKKPKYGVKGKCLKREYSWVKRLIETNICKQKKEEKE